MRFKAISYKYSNNIVTVYRKSDTRGRAAVQKSAIGLTRPAASLRETEEAFPLDFARSALGVAMRSRIAQCAPRQKLYSAAAGQSMPAREDFRRCALDAYL